MIIHHLEYSVSDKNMTEKVIAENTPNVVTIGLVDRFYQEIRWSPTFFLHSHPIYVDLLPFYSIP